MESIDFSQLCPRCGGKLESKDTIESLKTGSPTDFFQCKDCGYVHTAPARWLALCGRIFGSVNFYDARDWRRQLWNAMPSQ